MNEILFRGWSEDRQKWVYGNYFKMRNIHFIGKEYLDPHSEVHPDSIGIYINKNDKNGNKIFCGCNGAKYGSDIIKDDYLDGNIQYGSYQASIGVEFKSLAKTIEYVFIETTHYKKDEYLLLSNNITRKLQSVYGSLNYGYFVETENRQYGLTEANIGNIEVISNQWEEQNERD